jgi:hypothetical protein
MNMQLKECSEMGSTVWGKKELTPWGRNVNLQRKNVRVCRPNDDRYI